MPLLEYLYIDERRLNTYFQQISDPQFYDKIPYLEANISLTGPKAKIGQTQYPRDFTTHEKIVKLIRHLKQNHDVYCHEHYESKLDCTTPFHLETFQATRVFIPPNQNYQETLTEFNGIRLWISFQPNKTSEHNACTLYLLEDTRESDGEGNVETISAYSSLHMLLHHYSPFLEWTIINESTFNFKSEIEFLLNPIDFLSKLGAHVITTRKITSLYRLREVFYEDIVIANKDNTKENFIGAVGYPIFIIEGSHEELGIDF